MRHSVGAQAPALERCSDGARSDDTIGGFRIRPRLAAPGGAKRTAAAVWLITAFRGNALDRVRLHAAERRKRRGQGKPETLNFLGFHAFLWEVPDPANFGVRGVAMAKRLRVASQAIKTSLLRHLHRHPSEFGRWLQRVVRSYFNHHAVPGNYQLPRFALRWPTFGCACFGVAASGTG